MGIPRATGWRTSSAPTRALALAVLHGSPPPTRCRRMQVVKYGVVGLPAVLQDLHHWSHLYVGGRLHKPVALLEQADEAATAAYQHNLRSALATALLLLQHRSASMQVREYGARPSPAVLVMGLQRMRATETAHNQWPLSPAPWCAHTCSCCTHNNTLLTRACMCVLLCECVLACLLLCCCGPSNPFLPLPACRSCTSASPACPTWVMCAWGWQRTAARWNAS